MRRETATVGTVSNQPGQQRTITAVQSEEIHIRNFDDTQTYDLTVTVRREDDSVLSNTYNLTPGRRISEIYRLPAGIYDVTAKLDTLQHATTRCEIGSTAQRTALIEVGNGIVSVTQGLL